MQEATGDEEISTGSSAYVLLKAEKRARSKREGQSQKTGKEIEPKQGHHVINKGVLNIYHDIIKKFIEDHKKDIFNDKNYGELKQNNVIIDGSSGLPTDFLLRTNPLPDVRGVITTMTVDTPSSEKHTDRNDEAFGRAKIVLLTCVHSLMLSIYRSLKENNEMPENISDKVQQLSDIITGSFIDQHDQREVYVDRQAFRWREKEKGSDKFKKSFEDCRKKVNKMFQNIADKDGIQLVIHWGQWAFRVRQGLFFQQN